MMRVGKVRVAVNQRLMAVRMAVTGARRHRRHMHVVVMDVAPVHMLVRMFHRLVHMPVFVPLRQMQGDADGHQHAGNDQCARDGLSQ